MQKSRLVEIFMALGDVQLKDDLPRRKMLETKTKDNIL